MSQVAPFSYDETSEDEISEDEIEEDVDSIHSSTPSRTSNALAMPQALDDRNPQAPHAAESLPTGSTDAPVQSIPIRTPPHAADARPVLRPAETGTIGTPDVLEPISSAAALDNAVPTDEHDEVQSIAICIPPEAGDVRLPLKAVEASAKHIPDVAESQVSSTCPADVPHDGMHTDKYEVISAFPWLGNAILVSTAAEVRITGQGDNVEPALVVPPNSLDAPNNDIPSDTSDEDQSLPISVLSQIDKVSAVQIGSEPQTAGMSNLALSAPVGLVDFAAASDDDMDPHENEHANSIPIGSSSQIPDASPHSSHASVALSAVQPRKPGALNEHSTPISRSRSASPPPVISGSDDEMDDVIDGVARPAIAVSTAGVLIDGSVAIGSAMALEIGLGGRHSPDGSNTSIHVSAEDHSRTQATVADMQRQIQMQKIMIERQNEAIQQLRALNPGASDGVLIPSAIEKTVVEKPKRSGGRAVVVKSARQTGSDSLAPNLDGGRALSQDPSPPSMRFAVKGLSAGDTFLRSAEVGALSLYHTPLALQKHPGRRGGPTQTPRLPKIGRADIDWDAYQEWEERRKKRLMPYMRVRLSYMLGGKKIDGAIGTLLSGWACPNKSSIVPCSRPPERARRPCPPHLQQAAKLNDSENFVTVAVNGIERCVPRDWVSPLSEL